MTSALNKFEILRKDNKWNSMSPKQDQIIALAFLVDTLKDNKPKLFNSFKTSPSGKGRVKVKYQDNKQAVKQSQYGKVK